MKNAVFFITVDSLRSDFVTRDYKEGVRLTPFLDKLSAKATVFSNFYANSIPTFFAFPSIFSGRFPFYNGNRLGIDKGESFVEYLRDLGYLTLAFQANNSWLGRQYGYSNGFLEYEDFSAIGGYSNRKFKSMARALLPGCAKDFLKVARLFINRDLPAFSPDAMKVTDKVVDRVRSIDSNSNVFVWVHYLDVHWKYLNGLLKFESILNRRATFTELRKMLKNFPKYLEYSRNPQSIRNGKLEIPNDEVDFAKDLYASSVSYTDHAIERLFEVVKNVFCDRRTVFVVTSDHGENFAEHGTVIHEPTQLFNEVLRVPFVLYDSASSEETKVISSLYQHSDIARIMKEITKGAPIQDRKELDKFIISEIPFGCTAKQLSHNVIDNKASIGDYSKMYAVILNNKKYILTEQYESCEAYDLINDPMEEHNIMTEVSREEMEHLGLTLKQYKNSKLKQRIRLRVKDN